MDGESVRRLPLHPGVYGCLGCGVVVVALVGLGAYGVARALQEIHSEDVTGTGPTADVPMQRVPGGIVRGELVPADTATVRGLGWRDGHRVTFVRQRIPSFGEIMRVSGGGTVMPFWDEKRMEEQSLKMAGRFEARHISEYDVRTGKLSELAELPENMFFGGGDIIWDPQGRRALVLLKPFDMLLDEMGTTSVGLYAFEPGGSEEWTLLVDKGSAIWGAANPRWTPDGAGVVYSTRARSDAVEWHIVDVKTRDVTDLGEEAGLDGQWVRRDAKPMLACGVIGRSARGWLGWVSYRALTAGEPTGQEAVYRGTRLGRLTADEQVVSYRFTADDGTPRTAIAVINLATAELRWIRDDLKGRWEVEDTLLDGRALVLNSVTGWYNPSAPDGDVADDDAPSEDVAQGESDAPAELPDDSNAAPANESADGGGSTDEVDFDAPSECLDRCIMSLLDGGLVSLGGISHELVVSPDGSMAALRMTRSANVLGLVPAPVEGLGILEFVYPEELLTGGARQPVDKDK